MLLRIEISPTRSAVALPYQFDSLDIECTGKSVQIILYYYRVSSVRPVNVSIGMYTYIYMLTYIFIL
jgi:hypothetical protein